MSNRTSQLLIHSLGKEWFCHLGQFPDRGCNEYHQILAMTKQQYFWDVVRELGLGTLLRRALKRLVNIIYSAQSGLNTAHFLELSSWIPQPHQRPTEGVWPLGHGYAFELLILVALECSNHLTFKK